MFARWRKTTATPAPEANTITGHDSSSSTAEIGSEIAAAIEASDAYRKTRKTGTQHGRCDGADQRRDAEECAAGRRHHLPTAPESEEERTPVSDRRRRAREHPREV